MQMTTKSSISGAAFLVLMALLIASTSVRAFTPQHFSRGSTDLARSPSCLAMSDGSKDDEIAKLEEQLRKLKEEKGAEVPPEATTTATVTPTALEENDEEMISEEEASMDMFLSEGWKEARSNYDPGNTATRKRQEEEQGSLIGTVAKVAGGILALIIFSQIPLGQEDLSKYSAIKSGPATSTIDLGDINSVKGQSSGDL
mmetsp:Transcript_2059/g.4612  ORF Transcript_2059/g.4612 Transcript_2059/m.4612 type:complete len:200 (+) Transcript_2059:232-831(+)|eukprot:CAMPEP_0172394134 /NCGR_PEP_ID=MMETSP1061-20121228/13403_1 /TAXON_ID=37318 /ORGANISM="Pseudo-nitzschia pungens, Strain cf. pungens" /LENGTH=199 /DNA_ID=CAMNT_0013125417 /DNA_START=152 /DNA_END=751 /DNA_ORIENTATION=+